MTEISENQTAGFDKFLHEFLENHQNEKDQCDLFIQNSS